jgi:alpha-methylacyl-CoA racemase
MGPLAGVKVVEVAGIGPGPFCGMMLADMGADVISVERATRGIRAGDPLKRSRHIVTLNLKKPAGLESLLKLADRADILFEGYRPGVAERLGFGPDVCLARNPKLVFGRMTGWGQTGPLAQAAGHDINYIALAGALHAIGRAGEKPVPPLNLVGDFGGGGMLLAFGLVCALFEAQRSGRGQVVDAAMIDGTAALMAMFIGMQNLGMSADKVGGHFLSGAAHYYDTYETADGKYVSIGSLEPEFYELLIQKAGLERSRFGEKTFNFAAGQNPDVWKELKAELAAIFKSKTRDEWSALLEGTDVCYAPVLSLSEAPKHLHNAARRTFVEVDGVSQNAPAPRFSRTAPALPKSPDSDPQQLAERLARWGVDRTDVENILAAAKT